MSWIVELADEFVSEFLVLERPVRIELAANAELLKQFGPQLGRPALRGEQVREGSGSFLSGADPEGRFAVRYPLEEAVH